MIKLAPKLKTKSKDMTVATVTRAAELAAKQFGALDAVCRLSNICERYDVLVDLEGYPIISNSEAIHIITGEGFRKLKRVGQGSVNGDLIQDAFLEVSFEFFPLLFGGVRVVDVHEVTPVLCRSRVI